MTHSSDHPPLLRRLTHRYGSTHSGPSPQEEFPISPDTLGDLHSPKSLKRFNDIFPQGEMGLYTALKTDPQRGIASSDEPVQLTGGTASQGSADMPPNRIAVYGSNRIPERVGKTFLQLIGEALMDKTMILLTAAAVVSFLLGLYELLYQPPQFDPEGNPIKQVDWIEGVAIMTAVVVVVLVGAVNDYQKELQFAKLNRKKEDRDIVVVRDGAESLVSIHDLLVGDIITLQTGDVVPADSVLIQGSCDADESSMTGESDTIRKVDLRSALQGFAEMKGSNSQGFDIGTKNSDGDKCPDCMLISGSKLLAGLGKAVVTSVGTHSIYGRTMMALKVEPDPTPLQERLSQLADSISVYGCVAALILFLVLFTRFILYVALPNGRFHDLEPAQKATKFMNIFITAVTIIVVAVPEGLPLAVTLALAFATTRMTRDGNLVRNLRACETMGSATAVCSDKTGTLTENVMSIVRGVFGGNHFDDGHYETSVKESSRDIFQSPGNKYCSQELKNDVLANIVLNSTAFENKNFDPEMDDQNQNQDNNTTSHADRMDSIARGRVEAYIGSKTETALLNMSRRALDVKFGSLQELRTNTKDHLNIEKVVQVVPFESSRKWAGVVVKLQGSDTYRFYVKGAAEIVSSKCQYMIRPDKKSTRINDTIATDITSEIEGLAVDALRAISLAHRDFVGYKSWPPQEFIDTKNEDNEVVEASPEYLLEKVLPKNNETDSMTLDGIVGIQDPLRSGVRDSVQQCQRAGVTVRMVTGDNIMTARAIARNCNILTPENFSEEGRAMEGPAFRKLSKEDRIRILPNLRVLARSSPEDKRILVETLKGMGDVVAVTGDGTNDAPALKLADVGFSMGISGTEVAREASDIILMTDDFSAIVDAIKWGRCVSISIKKFIQFQLIVNFTAVILTFVSSVASEDETSVLTAVQLLWVNLIMDTLAALALATDKPDPNIMNRKPRGRRTPLITPSTWKMILGQATLQLIVTFILHFDGQELFFPGRDSITGMEQQQLNAMTFNTFVWLQFFTLIVSRKLDEGDGIRNWRDRVSKVNLDFFQDLFRNYYFLTVMVFIGGCQVLIMFYGGAPFSIAPQTPAMWWTAIICGTLSLPVGALIRIIPDAAAIRVFPKHTFDVVNYYASFEFLRRTQCTSSDEESLLPESEESVSSTPTAF